MSGVLASMVLAALLPGPAPVVQSLTEMMADFADCAVRTRRAEARAIVLAPEWWREGSRLQLLTASACGKALQANQVTSIMDMPVSALAASLVRADFGDAGPATFADRSPLAAIVLPPRPAEVTGKPSRAQTQVRSAYLYADNRSRSLAIGECVARIMPDGARQWIIASAENGADVPPPAELVKTIADCGQKGRRASVDPNAVALAYYRLANSTPHPANETTH